MQWFVKHDICLKHSIKNITPLINLARRRKKSHDFKFKVAKSLLQQENMLV